MNEDQRACFDCGRPIPILEIRCKLCFVRFVDAHPGMEVYGANLQAEGNPRGGGNQQAAAPELYETLEDAMNAMVGKVNPKHPIWERAARALAHARGEKTK